MNRTGRNDPCPCGSGKKFKQCCQQGNPAASQAPSLVHSIQNALEFHQHGRLQEAEAIYRRVLALAPNNFDALHMLGVLQHQLGHHAQAIDLIERAIALDASDALAYNNLGDASRALGQFEKALSCFQKALAIQPDFYEVHNNLGECYRGMERFAEAIASFKTVIAHRPAYAVAYNNLALALRGNGQPELAVDYLQQALTLKPDFAKARHNLGVTCRILGRTDEALECFNKALSLKPDYAEAYFELGSLLLEQGQLSKALYCCQQAIRIKPGEDSYWSLFSEMIKYANPAIIDQVDLPILLQAFKKANVDPQKLERIAVALIVSDPLVQQLLLLVEEATDGAAQIKRLLDDGRLGSVLGMPLLLAVLEETIINNSRLERLLSVFRRILLGAANQVDGCANAPALGRFAAALALQCFANEYLYEISADEQGQLAGLSGKMTQAIQAGERFPALWLMLLGSYQALHRLPFAAALATIQWPDQATQAVVKRLLLEPLEEEKIKKEIPALSKISDGVSQSVRQQYEENPYPRWKRRDKAGAPRPVHAVLQTLFPKQVFPERASGPIEILVAGCGTGSDAIQVAQRFANANILAVDMSLTSLAYAKRATHELGISNIDYQQADILKLGVLQKRFDLIVCGGVLHHMGDPFAGWQVLVNLLQPDGYMNIALYSQRARQLITVLRQQVAEKGYAATTEGIRQFRKDVLAGSKGEGKSSLDLGGLLESPDFYSLSACRDLIFHVQEHLFTPLEIQSCLDRLGLAFIGFETANLEIIKRYKKHFPGDEICNSLANWETVEIDNPEIFAGMYQFWLKRHQGE